MSFDKTTLTTAMILDAIIALGYLTYSAVLLLASVFASGFTSIVLYVLSGCLFLYVFVCFGNFSGILPGIFNTGLEDK